MKARHALTGLKRDMAAVTLQSVWRMWCARKAFLRTRNAAITIQCGVRRVLARRVLKRLKVEARSVEGMKAKTVGLEKKIIELQQTMDRRIKAAQEKQVRRSSCLREAWWWEMRKG